VQGSCPLWRSFDSAFGLSKSCDVSDLKSKSVGRWAQSRVHDVMLRLRTSHATSCSDSPITLDCSACKRICWHARSLLPQAQRGGAKEVLVPHTNYRPITLPKVEARRPTPQCPRKCGGVPVATSPLSAPGRAVTLCSVHFPTSIFSKYNPFDIHARVVDLRSRQISFRGLVFFLRGLATLPPALASAPARAPTASGWIKRTGTARRHYKCFDTFCAKAGNER